MSNEWNEEFLGNTRFGKMHDEAQTGGLHRGGVIGLKPSEYAAILSRGAEEVIPRTTERDTRFGKMKTTWRDAFEVSPETQKFMHIVWIETTLNHLVKQARDLGYVVTVEQRPLQPLAMGNTEAVVSLREARVTAPIGPQPLDFAQMERDAMTWIGGHVERECARHKLAISRSFDEPMAASKRRHNAYMREWIVNRGPAYYSGTMADAVHKFNQSADEFVAILNDGLYGAFEKAVKSAHVFMNKYARK